MGTITVYEFGQTGVPNARGLGVADLSSQTARTQDATTSTTAESIALNGGTSAIIITAAEAHRVSIVDSTCATTYILLRDNGAGAYVGDFGTKGGKTLYYRLDA